MPRLLGYFFILAGMSACTVDRGLVGLPPRGYDNALDEAEAVHRDLHSIDAWLDHAYGRGHASGPIKDPLRYYAYRAALEAQLGLAAEHFKYDDSSQRTDPGRPPIKLYPRSILPAIPEATEVITEDGESAVYWFVPVVINRIALSWSDEFDTRWLGLDSSTNMRSNKQEHFDTFLIPHGATLESEPELQSATEFLVQLEDIEIDLPEEASITLPALAPEHFVIVAAIPMRSAKHPRGIEPGFYDLRSLPQLDLPERLSSLQHAISVGLREGDWFEATLALRQLRIAHEQRLPSCSAWHEWLTDLVEATDRFPAKWFAPQLVIVEQAAQECRSASSENFFYKLAQLEQSFQHVASSHEHPAPILLEAPAPRDEPFSFVIGSDLQYTSDLTWVRQFLGMLDGSFLPHSAVEQAPHALVSQQVLERVREAKFVVIVGDLSDGAALSSTPGAAIGSSLGLTPPGSPYGSDFKDLQEEFGRLRLPLFAVPGNHDGFANYGGFFNDFFAFSGDVLTWDPIPFPLSVVTHPIGAGLYEIGRVLPTVFKLGRFANKPYFDGLVEWRYRLGPVHFSFRYRGHSFVGLNSYNLDVMFRDQIGPLANNWGGGVDRQDAIWFDVMLRWMRSRNAEGQDTEDSPGHQFAFMHHDPRAGRPFLRTYEEAEFGGYDVADAPGNLLTFGYLGLGWSPHNPLWLPIITPITTALPRQLIYGDSKFNQEWMIKDGIFDGDHYGARQLVEAITWNLDGPSRPGGLSHLFFGHDDVPARSKWIHDDQAGRVFPAPAGEDWPNSKWSTLGVAFTPLFRQRTVAPAEWGRKLRREDGHNAVVMRCDDVGQRGSMHGFFLVTVDPSKERAKQVAIEWIQIPG